jgi:hypothetical protein
MKRTMLAAAALLTLGAGVALADTNQPARLASDTARSHAIAKAPSPVIQSFSAMTSYDASPYPNPTNTRLAGQVGSGGTVGGGAGGR